MQRKLALKSLNLPGPKPSAFNFGESTLDDLFPHKLKITAMIGNSHAAAFGETCFASGDVKATLGSGSSVLMNTGDKRVAFQNGMVTTICWSLPDRIDYALESIIVTAGAIVQWMRDQIGAFTHPMETEKMATSAPDNGGVYLVPAFGGLGASH